MAAIKRLHVAAALALSATALVADASSAREIRKPSATSGPLILSRMVSAPDGGSMLMEIAGSSHVGRRPTVLILHGTHGFADEYVTLARELAAHGYVAVAACWFAPGQGAGQRFVHPLHCPPQTPSLVQGDSEKAQARISALLAAVAALPQVNSRRIALIGHSRGAVAALTYASRFDQARAIVLNSGAYPPEAEEWAAKISAPILLMHGDRDSPDEGGSEMTDPVRAQAFAGLLARQGKVVKVRFYRRGRHNSFFSDRRQHRQQVSEIVEFLSETMR